MRGKNLSVLPPLVAACAQAYLQTGDKNFADFVFEMTDWLSAFQYQKLDPQHPLWVGGFMGCVDGRPVHTAPQAVSGSLAECLVHAAQVARKVGDVQRWERCKVALDRSLQFVMTLQYTDSNTQHFADWYVPVVVGAFHASHQDGNIRLDCTQQAMGCIIAYLTHVAETH